MLDADNPHTWLEVKAMTLREVWLINELFDARDEARAIQARRDAKKDKHGG